MGSSLQLAGYKTILDLQSPYASSARQAGVIAGLRRLRRDEKFRDIPLLIRKADFHIREIN